MYLNKKQLFALLFVTSLSGIAYSQTDENIGSPKVLIEENQDNQKGNDDQQQSWISWPNFSSIKQLTSYVDGEACKEKAHELVEKIKNNKVKSALGAATVATVAVVGTYAYKTYYAKSEEQDSRPVWQQKLDKVRQTFTEAQYENCRELMNTIETNNPNVYRNNENIWAILTEKQQEELIAIIEEFNTAEKQLLAEINSLVQAEESNTAEQC